MLVFVISSDQNFDAIEGIDQESTMDVKITMNHLKNSFILLKRNRMAVTTKEMDFVLTIVDVDLDHNVKKIPTIPESVEVNDKTVTEVIFVYFLNSKNLTRQITEAFVAHRVDVIDTSLYLHHKNIRKSNL